MAAHYIETLWNVERPSRGRAASVRGLFTVKNVDI